MQVRKFQVSATGRQGNVKKLIFPDISSFRIVWLEMEYLITSVANRNPLLNMARVAGEL